jgi:serine/threonine protein kinase
LDAWLQGVANRDLKLENLLLDRDGSDGTRPLLKICDFGYSKVRMSCGMALLSMHVQAA